MFVESMNQCTEPLITPRLAGRCLHWLRGGVIPPDIQLKHAVYKPESICLSCSDGPFVLEQCPPSQAPRGDVLASLLGVGAMDSVCLIPAHRSSCDGTARSLVIHVNVS